MKKLHLGGTTANKVFLGENQAKKVYLGSTLAYEVELGFYIQNLTNEVATVTLTQTGTPTATSNGSIYTSTGDAYSLWTTPTASGSWTKTIPANGRLFIASTKQMGESSSIYKSITCDKSFSVNGDITWMLNYNTNTGDGGKVLDLTGYTYCFISLFRTATTLVDASKLELPATTLADYCYQWMFYGCTSLTTPPELPATTLANSCYNNMFKNCTTLQTAPALPATTLAQFCYSYMFYNCTSLTAAPELPATTLAERCYYGMFWGCTSLTSIHWGATVAPSSTYCGYWVYNVPDTGTFYRKDTSWTVSYGDSAVPTGWTVTTY